MLSCHYNHICCDKETQYGMGVNIEAKNQQVTAIVLGLSCTCITLIKWPQQIDVTPVFCNNISYT